MEITLEYLTADNLDAVRAIHREDISEAWVDNADTIMELTQYGNEHGCLGHTYAVKLENTYIGLILLGEAIPWETDPEEMHGVPFYRLMGFIIDNRYRSRGIGGQVLELVIGTIYQEYGVRPIALGVHRDNHGAARFYERHGFVKTNAMEGNDCYFLRYPQDNYSLGQIRAYGECRSFVEGFFGDPVFSDPMLTCDEQLQTNLLNALHKPETHRVFGIYRADRLVGLFAFLVLPQEHYAEMLMGLSRDLTAYREVLSYLEDNLPGYDVDFVFNPRNHLLRNLLSEEGAEFEAEEQKMVLGDSLPEFDTTGVELFSDRYAQQYFDIHNRDMYWTGEKVAAAPERFRTFLAIEDGQVVGYMDVTYSFEENEPFDLFVLPDFRGKGYGRKLLTRAIQMNAPKGMMLLVEVDNEPAIRLYASVGFVKSDGPNYLTAHWKVDSSR